MLLWIKRVVAWSRFSAATLYALAMVINLLAQVSLPPSPHPASPPRCTQPLLPALRIERRCACLAALGTVRKPTHAPVSGHLRR